MRLRLGFSSIVFSVLVPLVSFVFRLIGLAPHASKAGVCSQESPARVFSSSPSLTVSQGTSLRARQVRPCCTVRLYDPSVRPQSCHRGIPSDDCRKTGVCCRCFFPPFSLLPLFARHGRAGTRYARLKMLDFPLFVCCFGAPFPRFRYPFLPWTRPTRAFYCAFYHKGRQVGFKFKLKLAGFFCDQP